MGTSSSTAIAAAAARLEAARLGLSDMRSGPDRYASGLLNAVMLGRTVTFALQNMRGAEPRFEEWYEPIQARLRADPIMRFFIELRNQLEKRTEDPTLSGVTIFNGGAAMAALGPPPPGACGRFIGDRYGRSGWMIRLPDGSEERFFVRIPSHIVESQVWFDTEVAELRDVDPIEAISVYLDRLEAILEEARHFCETR